MHPIYESAQPLHSIDQFSPYSPYKVALSLVSHWFFALSLFSFLLLFFASISFYAEQNQERYTEYVHKSFAIQKMLFENMRKSQQYLIENGFDNEYVLTMMTRRYGFADKLRFVDLIHTETMHPYYSLFSSQSAYSQVASMIPIEWINASLAAKREKKDYWIYEEDDTIVVGIRWSIFDDRGTECLFVWQKEHHSLFFYMPLIGILTWIFSVLIVFSLIFFVIPARLCSIEQNAMQASKNLENVWRRLRSAQSQLLHLEADV